MSQIKSTDFNDESLTTSLTSIGIFCELCVSVSVCVSI